MTEDKKYVTLDESLANLVQQLGEGEPRVLAHLTEEEHAAIAVGFAFNAWAKIDVLEEFLIKYLLLSPARRGIARKQLTNIGMSAMRGSQDEDAGLIRRLRRAIGGGRD